MNEWEIPEGKCYLNLKAFQNNKNMFIDIKRRVMPAESEESVGEELPCHLHPFIIMYILIWNNWICIVVQIFTYQGMIMLFFIHIFWVEKSWHFIRISDICRMSKVWNYKQVSVMDVILLWILSFYFFIIVSIHFIKKKKKKLYTLPRHFGVRKNCNFIYNFLLYKLRE